MDLRLFDSVAPFYDTLTEWIRVLGPNSGLIKSSSLILDTLIENIKPFRTPLLLVSTREPFKANLLLKDDLS